MVKNQWTEKELTPYSAELFISRMYGRYLANPDKTLEENSYEGLSLYSKILRLDSQLAFCFRKRAGFVLAQAWDILPGGETPKEIEIAEAIQKIFLDIQDFQTSRTGFFLGIAYGFRPAEIIYFKRTDGLIGIRRFKNRDPQRFRFDENDQLIYTGLSGAGAEIMPPEKFVINTWGSDETPYGQGLLRELYPLWFFKANAVKHFVRYIEKLGIPSVFATYPAGTKVADQDLFFDQLKQMIANSVSVGPEGSKAELFQGDNSNVVQLFEFTIKRWVDEQFAKAILGQTTSTETESGTFALAKFQSKGQQAIVEEDSRFQEGELNKVIKNLVVWNWGPQQTYPQFSIDYEEEKDTNLILDGMTKAVRLGIPIAKTRALEVLGWPQPAEGEELLVAPAVASPFGGFGGGGESASGLSESSRDLIMLGLKKKAGLKYQKTCF